MDHLYNDGVAEISYHGSPDHLYFPWRGSLTDDDEGLEPTIVRSMD
ncbi:hypothetical protein SAMN05216188_109149 [Lentzea xinjiangensis]|uniref:Uncharacterized protein n=1 Tax=Lentzea xinjiangensis TaxID=402600 RepID=A0A1H9MNM9_9PSEU|nr:hypothetical protein [Lentzea xinjiangensis]SER25077.1 hypothetical protein SAMN05216188_109149 [Lentzea xinjiangensis]